jgi:hypothetical protein
MQAVWALRGLDSGVPHQISARFCLDSTFTLLYIHVYGWDFRPDGDKREAGRGDAAFSLFMRFLNSNRVNMGN